MKAKKDISTNISLSVAQKLINRRRENIDIEKMTSLLLDGDKTALSRAITLIESRSGIHKENASQILENCLPHANNSIRIGITGVPGVGKSTFIESLGQLLVDEGKKLAVLAVDPTSTVSRGSILGDKTRMEMLSQHPNAFIRPSAAGDSLGGVARKTREAIVLCEAAGYDVIIIETVGVGQSETAVHSMTDFFLLLKLAGAGDELQGIKRGIIEMADAILINKADGENIKAVRQAKSEISKALHLFPAKANGWIPKVSTSSALENKGIKKTWDIITTFMDQTKENGYFQENRKRQNEFWLRQTIENALKDDFYNNPKIEKLFPEIMEAVSNGALTPFQAAERLLKLK